MNTNAIVNKVLEDNPDEFDRCVQGVMLFNFFVGRIMRETEGKANPTTVRNILKRKLGLDKLGGNNRKSSKVSTGSN
ncbi:MAG: GatB/YqeY domain-containing protein [Candidatus Thorarchaeota archaeon]|jgi:Asp-tRNA(Asn)/Glu-tRNA(Gln) amidotransferase B subunit